ncbi:MAG: hypothetical protein JWR26_3969 [Pedosphaera sp.]|nr:hypothetical protein [Pedosphaera sp.]
MSSQTTSKTPAAPLDLSKWRHVPMLLIVVGGCLALLGAIVDSKQFGFSYLLAFMFFLSLCLGGLGMVILHHLFDASWSVPIRRICEHLAFLLPVMAILFIPIAILAPKMYPWMHMVLEHTEDHSLHSKYPLFTIPGFYLVVVINFCVWTLLSYKLRYWSLKQDETGSVECTRKMRKFSAFGVFLFAVTLTLAAIMWMKALQHEWFSTMYGVWYFAGSMWLTIYTIYTLTLLLKRQGPLREVATDKTFYYIGSLMFAFTVFYAYITFFQYFIIWNANVPEETFWFVGREAGTWWYIGLIIIFGHFFLPFLTLLRIDVKVSWAWVMVPLGVWAWIMHFTDLTFNIMPVLHPKGFALSWMDLACMAFIGGVLSKVFLIYFNSHPPLPQQDPRFAEAMDIYVESDQQVDAATVRGVTQKSGGRH